MVHGMGGLGDTVPGYGDGFAKLVAQRFHLSGELNNVTNPIVSTTGVTNFLRTFDFTNTENGHLNFYEVTWSPTTSTIKSNQFYKDSQMSSNGNRLPFNGTVKQIVDTGFGDAVLYLNPSYHKQMQEPILTTIEKVAHEATNDDDNVVFITHSLGSKMALDTLLENPRKQYVMDLTGKTTDIIMLANQLPLLDLGSDTSNRLAELQQSVPATSSVLTNFVNFAGTQKRHRHAALPNYPDVNIVAATDPNDALSYPLAARTDVINGIRVSFSDIYRYNSDGIFTCFVLNTLDWPPLLESPLTAHTGYLDNMRLARKLVEGFTAK
jgi:hypothetical protein